MRVVGVLPAAGRAARLQPLAGSKELLELGGRPVLEYAVERLRAGGADETRRDAARQGRRARSPRSRSGST
jgi:CTP:molybdopterin cytidylyltransferase MocA